MKKITYLMSRCAMALIAAHLIGAAQASSHMDAPLITRDPAANTTDVYAFVQNENGTKSLVTALGVYPHEEPGVGPNKYNFDDNVLYQIRVATGNDVAVGKVTLSYEFKFDTTFRNQNTILQSYLGVINDVGDANQNLVQTYTVTKVDHSQHNRRTVLGSGIVPPNNQGVATPFYNQGNDGNNPAKDGVATEGELDRYTTQTIKNLGGGYFSFAGQRDDGPAAGGERRHGVFQLLSGALRPAMVRLISVPSSFAAAPTIHPGRYCQSSDPRTLALYLATRHESPETALRLARAELDSRSDVFTHDALAWSLAAAGKLTEALSEMQRALAEGTQDARLLFHAGVIASQAGHTADAERRLRKANELSHLLLPSERNELQNMAAHGAEKKASVATNPQKTFSLEPNTAENSTSNQNLKNR